MAKKTAHKQDNVEKLLRYILGVRPDEFGLHPDEAGYVTLKELLAALHDEDGFRGVREGQIMMLINLPGDVAAFEREGDLIRLKPSLSSLPPEKPGPETMPKVLFLPLKPAAWAVIHEKGLHPKTGETVCRLWADKALAEKVGRRLAHNFVLISVQATQARKSGAGFRPYSEILWLTESVGAEFLTGPPVPPKEEQVPLTRHKEKLEPAGSFFVDNATVEIHQGKKKGKYGDSPDWKNQIRRDRRKHDRDE